MHRDFDKGQRQFWSVLRGSFNQAMNKQKVKETRFKAILVRATSDRRESVSFLGSQAG
jgi:hypothetical protein